MEWFRCGRRRNFILMARQRQEISLFPIWHGIPILWRMRRLFEYKLRRFRNNLLDISKILASQNPNAPSTVDTLGFPTGYGYTQQEVLTYAFLSAYSGKSPDKKNRWIASRKFQSQTGELPMMVLSKLKFFQSFLTSFSLSHGYRFYIQCQFLLTKICCFEGDLSEFNSLGTPSETSFPKYDFQQITIAEQWHRWSELIWHGKTVCKPVLK